MATEAVMTTVNVDDVLTSAKGVVDTWKFGTRIVDYSIGELAIIQLYMGILAFVGITANGVVLYLFATTRTLRTPMNWLFISLTMGDFTVSLFASFPAFIHTVAKIEMAESVCIAYGFFAYLGGVANLHALSTIAIERFLTVARPFNIGGLTKGRSVSFLAYTWTFSLVIAVSPLFGFSKYVHESPGFWCSVEWEDDSISGDAYIFFIFFTSYFLPLGIIIFSYTNVVLKIKEVAKAAMSEHSVKAEKSVLRQTYVMVSGFVIAWTPYAAVAMTAAIQRGHPFSPKVALAPAMFAKSSTLYNPFIYIGMNKQFRHAFVKKFFGGKDPFQREAKTIDPTMNTTYQDKTALPSETAAVAPPGGNGNKVAPMQETTEA